MSDHYRAVMDRTGLSPEDSPIEVLGRFPPTSREDYRDILQPEALSRLGGDRFVCDYSSGSTGRCVLRLATPADELAEQAVTERVFRRAGMRGGDTFVCADVGFPEIYEFYARAARALGVARATYLHLNRDYGRVDGAANPTLSPRRTSSSPCRVCWPGACPTCVRPGPAAGSPSVPSIFMGEPMRPRVVRRCRRGGSAVASIPSGAWDHRDRWLAGECDLGAVGCHFDPTLIGREDDRPARQVVDEATVQGELSLTTWHLRDHTVVKYGVGDVVRVTTRPCGCGETSPRLTVVERTHEGFVIAGARLRHQTASSTP